jgi:hypothetical protein
MNRENQDAGRKMNVPSGRHRTGADHQADPRAKVRVRTRAVRFGDESLVSVLAGLTWRSSRPLPAPMVRPLGIQRGSTPMNGMNTDAWIRPLAMAGHDPLISTGHPVLSP